MALHGADKRTLINWSAIKGFFTVMLESDSFVIRYLLPIGLAFLLAWLTQRLAASTLRRFLLTGGRVAPELVRLRQERQETLHGLIASAITFIVYVVAAIFTLSLFIETTTIIWMIGLFSAAFGIGANVLIRDFLTGFSFIFEDTIDVGDKVEVLEIQGVVEKIKLRTMFIRSTTGELYIVPNGEVRVIRNFSRGSFSTATVNVRVVTDKLETALILLEEVGIEAQLRLPNVIEPWKVISTSESVGHFSELAIVAKTRYGKAAEARPRMVGLIQERLRDAEIELINE